MSLLLPFALQWSLGGFENSSAVCLWAFTVAAGGAAVRGGASGGSVVRRVRGASSRCPGAIDPALAAGAPDIPSGVVVTFLRAQHSWRRDHRVRAAAVLRTGARARAGQVRAPAPQRAPRAGGGAAQRGRRDHRRRLSRRSPCCSRTSSASRRCPSGCPRRRSWRCWTGVRALGRARRRARRREDQDDRGRLHGRRRHSATAQITPRRSATWRSRWPGLARARRRPESLQVRIGIDTGPVVAGVIGRAKFIYDLWGDTVNTASRMESHALPGTIQVTERTYERLRERYELRPRGTIEIKGKGPMTTYRLLSRRGNQASTRPDVAVGVAPTATAPGRRTQPRP